MPNGSRRNFIYETDGGQEFWYNADEGWTESIVAAGGGAPGSADYLVTSAVDFSLPGNVTPRTVLLRSTDGKRQAEVIVPTLALFNAISNTGTFTVSDSLNTASNTLRLSMKKGERIQIPLAADTGLQDGDDP